MIRCEGVNRGAGRSKVRSPAKRQLYFDPLLTFDFHVFIEGFDGSMIEPKFWRPLVTQASFNRASLVLPLLFSAAAFALVIANILAGVAPQPDEGTSAHVWQLLMLAQFPMIVAFLATADWRTRWPLAIFGLQLAAFATACVPVWLAGY